MLAVQRRLDQTVIVFRCKHALAHACDNHNIFFQLGENIKLKCEADEKANKFRTQTERLVAEKQALNDRLELMMAALAQSEHERKQELESRRQLQIAIQEVSTGRNLFWSKKSSYFGKLGCLKMRKHENLVKTLKK